MSGCFKLSVHMRWMIARDRPEVLAIEKSSFVKPWTESDFALVLKRNPNIGLVAEHGDKVVGFVIYHLGKRSLSVLNVAVAPDFRRLGVGTAIIEKIKTKIDGQVRREVLVNVHDSSLPAQLFFKSVGFRAVAMHRELIQFQFGVRPPEAAEQGVNRIAGLV